LACIIGPELYHVVVAAGLYRQLLSLGVHGAGLIPDILDAFPEAQVVGSKVALMYLKGLTHRPFEQKPVKGGEKVELGAGHTLEFVMAPNLHW